MSRWTCDIEWTNPINGAVRVVNFDFGQHAAAAAALVYMAIWCEAMDVVLRPATIVEVPA